MRSPTTGSGRSATGRSNPDHIAGLEAGHPGEVNPVGRRKDRLSRERDLNAVLRNIAFTSPTTVYVGLHTAQANPEAGTVTEVSGGNYSRQAVAFGAPSAGLTSNTGDIVFAVATANWGTVVGGGIYDAAVAGNLLYYGPLTVNKTVNTNDQFKFLAGSITVQEL
jgi:hypothetical protein